MPDMNGKAGNIRLRDFIETIDGYFFSVVGYNNIPKVRAYLRYIPHAKGERCSRLGMGYYKKLGSVEADEIIRKRRPEYRENGIHMIPLNHVVRVYKPDRMLYRTMQRDPVVKKIVRFFSRHVPFHSMGVTGSLLIGMETEKSDIDFVVYGNHWFIAREILARSLGKEIGDLNEDMWRAIYSKRKVSIPFDVFMLHEKRKYIRGMMEGRYFDLLYVRDWMDMDGIIESKGEPLGKRTIEAKVVDSTHAYDYPAVYVLDHEDIRAVLSFTHTYIGQVQKGELLEARGMVEVIGKEKYLIVGTSREAVGEYIISKTLLEERM
jgi:hypothetical protein